MSMSDCINCWETPCVCGSGYRDLSDERRIEIASAALGMKPHELRAQLSAQSVSAVQPFGWVNSVNAEFTRKTGGSVALWPKKYDDTDLALYTRSADADAVDAKKGAEIIAAAKNLVAVMGRHHSEQAYKRLAAAIAAQSTEGAKG